jgi:hypothetical protein
MLQHAFALHFQFYDSIVAKIPNVEETGEIPGPTVAGTKWRRYKLSEAESELSVTICAGWTNAPSWIVQKSDQFFSRRIDPS